MCVITAAPDAEASLQGTSNSILDAMYGSAKARLSTPVNLYSGDKLVASLNTYGGTGLPFGATSDTVARSGSAPHLFANTGAGDALNRNTWGWLIDQGYSETHTSENGAEGVHALNLGALGDKAVKIDRVEGWNFSSPSPVGSYWVAPGGMPVDDLYSPGVATFTQTKGRQNRTSFGAALAGQGSLMVGGEVLVPLAIGVATAGAMSGGGLFGAGASEATGLQSLAATEGASASEFSALQSGISNAATGAAGAWTVPAPLAGLTGTEVGLPTGAYASNAGDWAGVNVQPHEPTWWDKAKDFANEAYDTLKRAPTGLGNLLQPGAPEVAFETAPESAAAQLASGKVTHPAAALTGRVTRSAANQRGLGFAGVDPYTGPGLQVPE